MTTYWDSFISDYKEQLHYLSMRVMLEAFFYYCNNEKDKCNVFIKKNIYE